MKKYLLLTAVFVSLNLLAEIIPVGYYDAIEGKQDSVLKSTLSQIIYPIGDATIDQSNPNKLNNINSQYTAGNRYKYQSRNVNEFNTHYYTWDGFLYTDMREDGSVWDMYSPRIHYMALDNYGAVSIPDLEIEHCFPKSWWGGTDNDAYKDLHHLNPANARANNNKSAYPPGYPTTNITEYSEIFKMGKNDNYGSFFVFEPCDEYKGDFARAYFYIVTAYEQFIWASAAENYLENNTYLEFKPWLQQVLLEWHRLDPVSEKEITRNNRVSDIQHNRNPYIDYPELVEYIWGNKQNSVVDLSQLTFTGSEEYVLPIETLVSRALPATNITASGFTANWKDAGKENYEIDVYSSTTTGNNDTIINMPIFNKNFIQADSRFSTTGSFGTTGIGKSSVTFGTTSNALKVTIQIPSLPSNSRIVLRAMAPLKINNTAGAQMKISANGTQIASQVLTHDEEFYSFSLPTGTTTIVIEQGNGKLFNVQQLFIISGNEVTTNTSLPGYPKIVNGTNFNVQHAMDENTILYYTIEPNGLKKSVPISVSYSVPSAVCNTPSSYNTARKQIRDGQLVIVRGTSIFSTLGQEIR